MKIQEQLKQLGITVNAWTKEQVEMRLGYARRLNRIIQNIIPDIEAHHIAWSDWMEKVCLYYYYPEKLADDPDWLRELGEILVTCEQLEAYSNRTRGNDYYNRNDESFENAFNYLDSVANDNFTMKISQIKQATICIKICKRKLVKCCEVVGSCNQ